MIEIACLADVDIGEWMFEGGMMLDLWRIHFMQADKLSAVHLA